MHDIRPVRVVIDLGNTRMKVALFEADTLQTLRIFRKGAWKQFEAFLSKHEKGSYCIVSSVIDYPDTLKNFLSNHFKTLMLNPETPVPLINLYKTKETLGKDRIAAAVAAWQKFPEQNILVIDAGTAITTDIVTSNGDYLGGSISPGMKMRFKALNTFTGRLPLVKKQNIRFLTGTSTEDSISSGVINGIVAEIDGFINAYKDLYPSLVVVFGGGDSEFFAKRLKNSIFALPNPVLNGLHIILNYNIENKNFA